MWTYLGTIFRLSQLVPRLYSKWMTRWFSLGVKDMTSLGGACMFSHVWLFATSWTVQIARLFCPWDSPLSVGMLGWVAISSSRGSSWHRDQTCVYGVCPIGRWILDNQCHLGCPLPLSLDSHPSTATSQLGSWVNYLTPLCFCFLIWKMG